MLSKTHLLMIAFLVKFHGEPADCGDGQENTLRALYKSQIFKLW